MAAAFTSLGVAGLLVAAFIPGCSAARPRPPSARLRPAPASGADAAAAPAAAPEPARPTLGRGRSPVVPAVDGRAAGRRRSPTPSTGRMPMRAAMPESSRRPRAAPGRRRRDADDGADRPSPLPSATRRRRTRSSLGSLALLARRARAVRAPVRGSPRSLTSARRAPATGPERAGTLRADPSALVDAREPALDATPRGDRWNA